MSFPTQAVLVHYGNWDDETRKHPAMKWMEDYTRHVIDERLWEKGTPASKYLVSDAILQRSDGATDHGADEVWKALAQIYGPFAAHSHIPEFLTCWETKDGWGMLGVANLHFTLHGLDSKAVTDHEGGKWDGVAPSAFQFAYVKDSSGEIKLKETKIFNDPSPAMRLMLKNKMINGEQLAGIFIGS